MLSEEAYVYLRSKLSERPVIYPEQAIFMFSEGFQATHLKCHLTAMQVAVESGFPPVIGIQFIDLYDKLYPWPHMVNRQGTTLIDCSPKANHPVLGFIETSWDDLPVWRRIVTDYNALGTRREMPSWGDPLADRLSADFLALMRAGCRVAGSRSQSDATPADHAERSHRRAAALGAAATAGDSLLQ